MFNNNTVLKLFFTVISLSITIAQATSSEDTKTRKSIVNEANSLGSISSRFLDLGGVISQIFSGFNQGIPGGNTGLNYPPNSQFYADVLAHGIDSQPLSDFGNKWSNLGQGMIQGKDLIGGIQSQQLNRPSPSSLNFNSQIVQHQGQLSKQAQGLSQILNIQNNNDQQLGPYTSGPQGNTRFSRSDLPQTPQHFTFEGDLHGTIETRNEGTLEDFFTTESTNNNNDKVIFPNHSEEATMETTTRNSIWGKLVKIPTTTVSSERIVFVDDSETPFQKQCVQNCPTTSEYNPVCGSDSVTYFNPGRLVCARNCGINVRQRRPGNCNSKSG